MKVYVDFEELDVEDRPTYICNKYNLQVKSINSGTRYDNVKLVSLSDYTKQVRKEVCEEIGQQLGLRFDGKWQVVCDGCMTGDKTIMAVLDQIQMETKK